MDYFKIIRMMHLKRKSRTKTKEKRRPQPCFLGRLAQQRTGRIQIRILYLLTNRQNVIGVGSIPAAGHDL